MKKLLPILFIAALLAGCTTRTDYGDCVGINDNKDTHLVYKVSVWNAVLGVVFIETIIVPIIVIIDNLYCPVSKKD
jgi:Slime mold cyclic AMP receptor